MRLSRVVASAAIASVLSVGPATVASAAPSALEYSGLTRGGGPVDLALGSDGNVWFSETDNPGAVARITPSGAIAEYSETAGLAKDGHPNQIVSGPDGMWVTLTGKGNIARVTTAGAVSQFSVGGSDKPVGIADGPDGNLWYTAQGGTGYVGRITRSGAVQKFKVGLTAGSLPGAMVRGPDGNFWFVEGAAGRIGRVTPQGAIAEFATGSLAPPRDITVGPDGNLWFTEAGANPAIGRITPSGVVTRFPIGMANSAPLAITAGGDDKLYFTDPGAAMIGQVTTNGAIAPYFPVGSTDLPGIVTGSDGALWVAAYDRDSIGRLSVAPLSRPVDATAVGESSAQLTGALKPNSEATTASFEWGTTTDYGQSTADQSVGMSGAQTQISASLSGLAPSTIYHVRLVTTNATGRSDGPDRTFSTTAADAPSATTGAASSIGPTDALLNAVVDPRSHPTTAHFEWGPTTAYGASSVEAPVGSEAGGHAISAQATGLEANTTYHFRAVATSNVDTTAGADQTFTSTAVPPDATTDAAVDVTGTTATLGGLVNPRNSATTYGFEWGSAPEMDNLTDVRDLAATDNQAHPVSAALTDLEPNTTHRFRLVARSEAGDTYGDEHTITTSVVTPLLVTGSAGDITTAAATLTGTVDPRKAQVTHWFEWGPSTAYASATPSIVLGGAQDLTGHPVEARIEGLVGGATYHYRAAAKSVAGTAYGADRTLTAISLPASAGLPPESGGRPEPEPQPNQPDSKPTATPAFGRTVAASVISGMVRVRVPGEGYADLEAAATIPNGALVDARRGTLRVVSALDAAGRTQQATFRGARFTISQPRSGRGVVDLRLRETPTGCPASASLARTSAKPKKAPSLWAKDRHGKYRTKGRNSVATVRGTVWITTETCAGTRTSVKRGSVAVVSRRTGSRVLVSAGRSTLARAAP